MNATLRRAIVSVAALVAAAPAIAQQHAAPYTVVESGRSFARLQDAVNAIGGGTGTIRFASMRFADGAVGTYVAHWNSTAPPMLRLFGDEVAVEVRLGQPEDAWATFPGKRRMRFHADQADIDAKAGVLEQDAAFLLAVAAGRTSAPWPASSLADHVASLELVEAIAAL